MQSYGSTHAQLLEANRTPVQCAAVRAALDADRAARDAYYQTEDSATMHAARERCAEAQHALNEAAAAMLAAEIARPTRSAAWRAIRAQDASMDNGEGEPFITYYRTDLAHDRAELERADAPRLFVWSANPRGTHLVRPDAPLAPSSHRDLIKAIARNYPSARLFVWSTTVGTLRPIGPADAVAALDAATAAAAWESEQERQRTA